MRNGLTIPPAPTARTVADMARHPNWWMSVLTTAPLELASLRSRQCTVADLVNHLFDPSADVSHREWLRSQWAGGSW